MFDGRFFLTNPFDFDYTCRWDGVNYEFKAMTTSPLLIETATPLQTQQIRRKFAKDLAKEAYMRSAEFSKLSAIEKQTRAMGIPSYVDRDDDPNNVLAPYIQKCLEPLPVVPVKVERTVKKEKPLALDPKTGKPVITLMTHEEQDNRSLVEEAANARE